MTWAGLILAVLGTIAGIVSSYFAYTGDRRARGKEIRHPANAGRSYQLQRRLALWVRINVIVIFLAVCIFAVGILLITRSGGSAPQSPGAEPTQPSITAPAKPSQSSGAPSPDPSSSGVWSKQWGPGTLLLTARRSVNFDQVPPNVNGSGIETLDNNYYNGPKFMASWTGNRQGMATAAACADLISTEGVQSVKPVTGDTYCLMTNQGNIAIFVVKRINVDSNGNMTSTLVQATVWTTSS